VLTSNDPIFVTVILACPRESNGVAIRNMRFVDAFLGAGLAEQTARDMYTSYNNWREQNGVNMPIDIFVTRRLRLTK